MNPPNTILYLSSVIPGPSTAGELILHRHFQQLESRVIIAGPPAPGVEIPLPQGAILYRLARTRLSAFAHELLELRRPPGLRNLEHGLSRLPRPEMVLTVAHGHLCRLASLVSSRLRVPLVTVFHDWWPTLAPVHDFFRPLLERRFRGLYRASRVAFCVSEPMREALGPHPDSRVLYPMPEPPSRPLPPSSPGPFRCAYAGLLQAPYGEMLNELSTAIAKRSDLGLFLAGPDPGEPAASQLKRRGQYSGFLSREELVSRIGCSDALLVAMSFHPQDRLRGETSFPSKLVEYCHYRKPLLIWGPENCTAVRWARSREAALVITDPGAGSVEAALDRLKAAPALAAQLASRAGELAETEFNPEEIHRTFVNGLCDALEGTDHRHAA